MIIGTSGLILPVYIFGGVQLLFALIAISYILLSKELTYGWNLWFGVTGIIADCLAFASFLCALAALSRGNVVSFVPWLTIFLGNMSYVGSIIVYPEFAYPHEYPDYCPDKRTNNLSERFSKLGLFVLMMTSVWLIPILLLLPIALIK